MNIWEELDKINLELKKEFLCVPPYRCVNGKFLVDLKQEMACGKSPAGKVKASINLPWQRAYQMEYRYKKCDIFLPYMPVIEYATYDAMDGNWICSYLSFLPVVEAVLRKWAEVCPDLSFNKIKGFTSQLIDFLKRLNYYPDDRKRWPESHVEFLQYILGVLYQDFDTYKQQNFAQIFNRNLSLHKLEGVINISEGLSNVTRILLVLDIIAELYLMQNPENYWRTVFYADPEANQNFKLRWSLYVKRASLSVGPNDLMVLYNNFINTER